MSDDPKTPAEALKPCPFCGGSASENHVAVGDGFDPSIDCDVCPALVSGISFEGAAMAWNSRVESLPPPELSAEDLRDLGAFVHNASLKLGVEAIGRDFAESVEGVFAIVRVRS